jgi:MFS family permease
MLGASEVQIGLISAITAATAIAARPPMGHVMDARGRRVVIIAGGVLNVLVCLLHLTVDRLGPWLYFVRALHGLSEAMLFAGIFTYATDLLPEGRRTEGIALYGVSGLLPMSLGGLLGDVILARSSYTTLFVASLVFAVASLLLTLPLREDRRPVHEVPARGFLASALQPDLLPLWFIGGVFATVLASNFVFLKTYVLATGVGSVGLFFTAYSVVAASLRLFLGWLPDRVGQKRVLFPALGALALGFLLLAIARSDVAVMVGGGCCGLGHSFVFPILSSMVVTRARPAERGAAISLFTALFDGGVLIGGPVLGVVIHLGGYAAMYASASAFVVFGAVAFALWDRAR